MIDPKDTIAQCVHLMQSLAAKGNVKLNLSLDNRIPRVRAEEKRLRQILLNLLSNAIKFTPSGGTVSVAASADMAGLHIVIADTGIGMRQEDIPRALESFGQIDGTLARKYDGTGLGLPLAKRLVELHGGTLKIDSTVGTGTTVTVSLPPGRLCPERQAA